MKKLHKIRFIFLALLIIPNFTFAFSLAGSTFGTVVGYVLSIVNLLTPILFGVAFLVFFWGLSKFILNANKPEEIKNGRNKMLWGILALFIMMTFRVLVGLVANELEIGNQTMNDSTIQSSVLLPH